MKEMVEMGKVSCFEDAFRLLIMKRGQGDRFDVGVPHAGLENVTIVRTTPTLIM